MARAFCIVYDAGGQKGLKKHTDGRKEGATLLLLLSTPGVDFEGGGTRFTDLNITVPAVKGSAVLWPSVTSADPSIDEVTTCIATYFIMLMK